METQKSKDDIFTFVRNKEKKVQICVGNFAITPKSFKTFKEAQEYVNSKPYEIYINLIYLAIHLENEKVNYTAKEIAENKETA